MLVQHAVPLHIFHLEFINVTENNILENKILVNVWKTAIPIKFIGVPTNQT
jgi:hypothetical protein